MLDARAGADRLHDAGVSDSKTSWRKARSQDLALLHDWYLHSKEPFVIEISGPELGMSLQSFVSWCSNDAVMWVAREGRGLSAFLWFSAIQPSLGVASIDWGFVHPVDPHGDEGRGFAQVLKETARQLELRKLHLLAMSRQQQRLELAQQLGFREEGCLREHFFHRGQLNDLLCLGWVSEG